MFFLTWQQQNKRDASTNILHIQNERFQTQPKSLLLRPEQHLLQVFVLRGDEAEETPPNFVSRYLEDWGSWSSPNFTSIRSSPGDENKTDAILNLMVFQPVHPHWKDGNNPVNSPVEGTVVYPIIYEGFDTSQVVQDFFHQQ